MNYNVKRGDIVVFKASGDWLSKAIAWFTQTDVSHAAMVYSADSIIEVGAHGIGVHKMAILDGDSVYVMRLKSNLSATPLIQSADAYLQAKVRYDFPALLILAGLLIYRRIVPSLPLMKLVNLILSAACATLDKALNRILHQSDGPFMICSQLVYQIYYDCGENYRIQIENGAVFNSQLTAGPADSICLVDLAKVGKRTPADMFMASSDEVSVSNQDMKEFYELLCASEQKNDKAAPDIIIASVEMDKTLALTVKFLDLLERLLESAHYDIPLEALFVTPGDLVYHAVNLENEGTINLQRVHSVKDLILSATPFPSWPE